MRQLLLVAACSALASAVPAGETAAPVPKEPESPIVEGSYTFVQVTSAPAPAGFAGPAGAQLPTRTSARTGRATISKSEIVLSGATPSPSFSKREAVEGRNPFTTASSETTMKYVIDRNKSPMTIDLYTVDLRNKKTKSVGIVEDVDDRVTIAVAKDGDVRPKSFEEAEGVTVYYFKKSPLPPRPEFRIVALTASKEAEAEKELNRLAKEGFELVSTTQPIATDPKASVTTIHFILKRTVAE